MFGLFTKRTKDDPQFGHLVMKGKAWTGSLRTPLFPEIDLPVILRARDEEELALCRKHLDAVTAHVAEIRSQIADEALLTYRMYQEEDGDTASYPDIASVGAVWPLIKPKEWHFEPRGVDHKSRVIIDFGWPNPHFLEAYLTDTELYQLDVAG